MSRGVPARGESAVEAPDRSSIRQARQKAAHRPRRIIVDNDGNEPVYYLKEATARALLDCRTTGLVGTQVDTIVYCTWSSGFGMFTHNTRVGQVFTCTEEGFSRNLTREFIEQGTDPLKIMVEFCRRNSIEIFWSMRMNDTHDAWGGWYSPYMIPELKRQHPEYLVASEDRRSKVGGWTAVDYARPEIRELAVKYIEEVCSNYDIDGVVLDYFRHPVYFKAHAMGGEAGQAERDMLTDMMRRIRGRADEIGLKRGRPILVTVRVPDSVGFCRAMGIDLVRWMEDGLIDLMAVSGYFRLSPLETSVELGHQYDVPLLACLSESRIAGDAGRLRKSAACYRGRAMNAWAAGVDGVYTFNLFDPKSSLWREIGDPKTIRPLERMYCTGARGTRVINRWMVNGERFLKRDPVSPERTRELAVGQAAGVELPVGEELGQTGEALHVTLDLQMQPATDVKDLEVALNGVTLSDGAADATWLRYPVEPDAVRKGINHIQVTLKNRPAGPAKTTLQDLILWVRP
jgi:hypothetical protein